jgi:ABC-type Mn2+/Zn2+ transport system permease subunit
MSAVTLWITVVGIVLVVAYLVAPHSKAKAVINAFGETSANNIRSLGGGVSFR